VSVTAEQPARQDADRTGSMTAIGGGILVFTSTEQRGGASGHGTTHTFVLDGASLDLPEAGLGTGPERHVDPRDPLAALVGAYLGQLAGQALDLSVEQRAELEGPTVELLRSLLARVAAAPCPDRLPAREPLGVRIMEHIRLHLTDRDLSVATVARHHNISERYVYLILSKFGVTFSDWVRLNRLRGAAADLADAGRQDETISSVAHRWGFADHASFTRAFRREFAVAPREFRVRNSADGARSAAGTDKPQPSAPAYVRGVRDTPDQVQELTCPTSR
jgi:AraC-like DNA-binding protein